MEILVIEQNPGDVKLFLTEFEEIEVKANFYIKTRGEDALKFLHNSLFNPPKPDLIVIDMHLPVMNGIELLQDIS